MREAHGRASGPARRPAPTARPVLQSIAALIEEQSGLALDEGQYRALDAAVAGRMDAADVGEPSAYLSLLRQARSGELRALIEAVANGETAFFRNAAHFRALRDVVLPALREDASPPPAPPTLGGLGGQSPRRVVLWSAGCATGEETYSLAIACLEAGIPAVAPVVVLGTDISQSALAAAERGEYSERHVANVGKELRERYFEALPRGWRVRDEVRSLVSWAPHNLLDPELPMPPESVDVLFCQNVTIYFRPETIRRVTERLAAVVREGGHFFPGFSETPWCRAPGLEMVSFGDCFAYRKGALPGEAVVRSGAIHGAGLGAMNVATTNGARVREPRSRRLPAGAGGSRQKAVGRRPAGRNEPTAGEGAPGGLRREEPAEGAPEAPAAPETHAGTDARLELARRAASEGDLVRAIGEVTSVLQAEPMLPEAWELFGLLQRQAGRRDEAERGFRRQLYLAPDSPLPHFHLATLFRERGWAGDARREYGRAARLLEAMPPETQIAGVTADLLLRACRQFVPGETQAR